MDGCSRRQYLAGVATAAGLAGCSRANPLGGEETTRESGGLTLSTVEAPGSPGGEVVVKPAGEPALVDFFATWCAPCKPQMAELRTVKETFPDFHLVSITREDKPKAVADFWKKYDGNWPVATDPKLKAFQAYSVQNVPTKVLVTADGKDAWRHTGLAAADTIVEEIKAIR